MDDTGQTLIEQLTELLEQRERALELRGEWKRVRWEWRQAWRAEAAAIAWELDRLGKGW